MAVSISLMVINHCRVAINNEMTADDGKKIMHGFTIWQVSVLAVWYMINVWVVQRW